MLLSYESTLAALGNNSVMPIETLLVHTYQNPRVQNQGVVFLVMEGG